MRVIDATDGIAGPLAAMILADFGAQVIRVGGGEKQRDELPGHVMWNRNKVAVPTVEATSLAADADILVTTDERHSLVSDAEAGPRSTGFVHLLLPGWGAAADANRTLVDSLLADRMMQADYGIARRQTSFSGGPVDCVYPFASYLQGAWGATAAIAALVERARTGLGQTVVVDPLHGAIVAATTTMFADPEVSLPSTSVGPGGPNPVFSTYQCGDGEWIFLGALGRKFQDIAFDLLGTTDITEHPRIAANREEIYAVDLRDGVRARIAEGFRVKAREHWLAAFDAAGCPASPVGERAEWLDHEQVRAMGQRVELVDSEVGPAIMGGRPVEFSDFPVPEFHPRQSLATASWEPRSLPVSTPTENASATLPGRGPLHGIRVLDLGTVLAGPYAGQLLSSLGADVVKVETPKGDEFRTRGYMINRGQRSLSIDLRDPRGHEAFMQLVSTSQVVVDNFRPGVLKRLGIDLEALRAVNADVVTTSITGYGGTGPMGDNPGYDPVVQALSGIMKAQGGDAEPVFCTVSVNDVTSACLAALGTCAALYQQAIGRGGQAVSTSLAAAAVFMQSNELVRYDGRPPAELGGRDYAGPSPMSRYYECRDGWARIHLPSVDAAVAAGLVQDGGTAGRELEAVISAAVAPMSVEELDRLVATHGGIATRARDNKELLLSTSTIDTGHIGTVTWPDGNVSYLPRSYAQFDRHRVNPIMTTPGMGEHSREVLSEAGIDARVIDELVDAGVVVQGEPLASVAGTGYR
ncbi:hypothetical protein A5689_17660 [Mycobacterium intracellulare subsp. yongonense]|nr:hypothetical protein A5689_17660 [Mycobacterium intracellulare subsp. yongonense]